MAFKPYVSLRRNTSTYPQIQHSSFLPTACRAILGMTRTTSRPTLISMLLGSELLWELERVMETPTAGAANSDPVTAGLQTLLTAEESTEGSSRLARLLRLAMAAHRQDVDSPRDDSPAAMPPFDWYW